MNRNQPQACTDSCVRPKARRATFDLQAVITWSLILVVAGAVTVLLWRPFEKEPEASLTPGTLPATVTPGGLASLSSSTITNPQPWQYDPATNRHWNAEPGHGHWHSGTPPNSAGLSSKTVPLPVPIKGLPPELSNLAPPGFTAQPSATTQPGVTPKPWEYNAATDKHWHPDHNHWHSGRPPANPSDPFDPSTTTAPATPVPGTPGGEIPAPWFHDTANDRHWEPNHGHWHPGPPPAGTGTPEKATEEKATEEETTDEAAEDKEEEGDPDGG